HFAARGLVQELRRADRLYGIARRHIQDDMDARRGAVIGHPVGKGEIAIPDAAGGPAAPLMSDLESGLWTGPDRDVKARFPPVKAAVIVAVPAHAGARLHAGEHRIPDGE